jgi:catechol 2,3-dioxygenase-like lactoylglutathione lyase family enzyme
MILDHVGYLVRDLDEGVEFFTRASGAAVDRTVERPQWSLYGHYIGAIEVFTFTDPQLLDERLGGVDAKLDHLAQAVDDIEAEMSSLRTFGAHFSGPDLRGEVDEPFDLGNARHVWTLPETTGGLGLQLIEYR